MATAQTAGKFAIVNTLLNMTDVTLIEQLNGRQGDNGREVFFWLKNGNLPFNISNKTIKITAKDASGKIKEISTVNNVINAEAGQFSMVIPAEMYQASGDIEEGYISVSDETGMVVSSIPIMFNVLGNNIIFTSNPSSDYIDAIEKLIKEAKDKLTSFDTALTAQQGAYDALKLSLASLVKEIEDKQVVTLNGNNVSTGDNDFVKPIGGSFKTREATFVSFDDVALNMLKYPGRWFVADKKLTNAPFDGWYTVDVITGSSASTGNIVADYYGGGRKITAVSDGKIVGWNEVAINDTQLMTSSMDLNALTATGTYKFSLTNTVTQTNGPDLINPVHNIKVATYADGSIVQELTDVVAGTEYRRSKLKNGDWGIWRLTKGQTPWVEQNPLSNITPNTKHTHHGIFIRFTPEAMELSVVHMDFGQLDNNNQLTYPKLPAMYRTLLEEKYTFQESGTDIASDVIDGTIIDSAVGFSLLYNLGVIWGARSNHSDVTFFTRFRFM